VCGGSPRSDAWFVRATNWVVTMHAPWLWVTSTIILVSGCARGMAPGGVNGQDPASVARALLEAGRRGDWRTSLRWHHPDALELDARQLIGRLGSRADSNYIVLLWPEVARDTALYQHRLRGQRNQLRRALDSVYRVGSLDEAAALPPDSLLARCNRAAPPLDLSRIKARPAPALLAQAQRGDSLAYVWFEEERVTPLPSPMRHPVHLPGTVVLRRAGDEWRGYLTERLFLFPLIACDRGF
jgi:hypothetical protein